MPNVSWTNPRDWLQRERVLADDMNEQVKNNLLWLFEKNLAIAQRAGVSDITWTNTVSTSPKTLFTLQLLKADDATALRFSFTGMINNSSTGALTNFDVKVDDAWYLSSGNDTPLTEGLGYYRAPTANRSMAYHFIRYIGNINSGLHTFNLVSWVSLGTGSLNLTNSMCQFEVEEYGIPDFQ